MNIIPSIASANQINIERELNRLGQCYENLHVDIEDGNFIPNITFGLKTIRAIRGMCVKPFSVHLMVNEPEFYIDRLADLNCSHIFIHVEGIKYLRKLINKIKKLNIKAGIALNPISNIEDYKYLFKDIDAVLFMTSEPDDAGEYFNGNILEKIPDILSEKGIELWVDGGVKEEYFSELQKRNIDYVVMGRDIFGRKDPQSFLKAINKTELSYKKNKLQK